MGNKYKIFKNGNKFDIYSVYGQFIVSCANEESALYLLEKLNKEEVVKGVKNGERSL